MVALRSIDEIGFYTISERRAQEISRLYRRGDPQAFRITRAEIVLGERCNLRCTFCKGLPGRTSTPRAAGALDRFLETWVGGGCDFVHLTGGEPTLWPSITGLVATIRAQGAISCMTSNGTAPFDLYRELVERGLRDIRISLHAHTEALFRTITGGAGIFRRVTSNLERLVMLRDRYFPDLYVMINLTVGEENFDSLPALLGRLLRFRANDIKPVAVVQWTGAALQAARRRYSETMLPELLAAARDGSAPILRYRLPSLLTKRLRGFPGRGHDSAGTIGSRCYLMLDDRCIDGEHYFPCNIYLREGGAPLGSHRVDTPAMASKRVWDFVQTHDVRGDPICRSCCPDITREYNALVERHLRGEDSLTDRLIC